MTEAVRKPTRENLRLSKLHSARFVNNLATGYSQARMTRCLSESGIFGLWVKRHCSISRCWRLVNKAKDSIYEYSSQRSPHSHRSRSTMINSRVSVCDLRMAAGSEGSTRFGLSESISYINVLRLSHAYMSVVRRFVPKHVRVRKIETMSRDCDEGMRPRSPAPCTSRRERVKYSRHEELKNRNKVSA